MRWRVREGWRQFAIIILASLVVSPALSQTDPERVRVNVSGSFHTRSGSAVEGAEVTLFDEAGVARAHAVTDANGAFVIERVAPGTYRLSVKVEGFEVTRRGKEKEKGKGKGKGELNQVVVGPEGTLTPAIVDVVYKAPVRKGMWRDVTIFIVAAAAAGVLIF